MSNVTERPNEAELEKLYAAARGYVGEKKGWAEDAYRLEYRSTDADRQAHIWAVHADDERGTTMGGGKSIELLISVDTHEVSRELRFQ